VAPAQHELAPVYTTSNIAADHNQLTMELMKKTALKHGLVCLLHEKPFDGLNGSGKHNNWSLSTDKGTNLLEPGETPYENAQFLLFVTALLASVDKYPELIRISVATAGNDCRLGGNEAPPTIISVFLGDELTEILESVKNGAPYGGREKELLRVGVHVLPKFPRDTTDRNRTSPIAFTGNKFEFRIPGSSASISDINTVINSVMAETLNGYADELEGSEDFERSLHELIRSEISAHERVIFNGNGYGDEWREEAARRGLPEIGSTPEACDTYLSGKNVALMTTLGILTREEMHARYEIMLESYVKRTYIEALTMTDMARREILPAVAAYRRTLSGETMFENDLSRRLKVLTDNAYFKIRELEKTVADAKAETGTRAASYICLKRILPTMKLLRGYCDAAESLTSEDFWPFPSYGDLLFALS
ncbi:MAG: glutamine synthetase type III, partial [Clostridia bacterium]|nr:glutamine synthetase type III [Clostridia bacterium]